MSSRDRWGGRTLCRGSSLRVERNAVGSNGVYHAVVKIHERFRVPLKLRRMVEPLRTQAGRPRVVLAESAPGPQPAHKRPRHGGQSPKRKSVTKQRSERGHYLVKLCLAAETTEPRQRRGRDAMHASRPVACLPFLPLDSDRDSWAIRLFRQGHDQDQRKKEHPSIASRGLCSRQRRTTHGFPN
jgi:hypothetical protein